MTIIASQNSLEKRREVTLMMPPDGFLSWRQRRSRRLCRQECHLHNHQRQSRQISVAVIRRIFRHQQSNLDIMTQAHDTHRQQCKRGHHRCRK